MTSDSSPHEPMIDRTSGLCGGPGQMSCDDANQMIQMVIDHLSDSDGEREFGDHLGECPPCEHEYVVYTRIVASLVRSRPNIPVDAAMRIRSYCVELNELAHGEAEDS